MNAEDVKLDEVLAISRELHDRELDRVLSPEEAATFTNYHQQYLLRMKDEIGYQNRGGKCNGFRKRNLIEWLKSNERRRPKKTKTAVG